MSTKITFFRGCKAVFVDGFPVASRPTHSSAAMLKIWTNHSHWRLGRRGRILFIGQNYNFCATKRSFTQKIQLLISILIFGPHCTRLRASLQNLCPSGRKKPAEPLITARQYTRFFPVRLWKGLVIFEVIF